MSGYLPRRWFLRTAGVVALTLIVPDDAPPHPQFIPPTPPVRYPREGLDLVGEVMEHLPGRLALVLSSGGARGTAEAAALDSLIKWGVRPSFIVGVSAGGWNGAWLARYGAGAGPGGSLPDVWIRFAADNPFSDHLALGSGYVTGALSGRDAALSADAARKFLTALFGNATFDELQTRLTVLAADLTTSQLVYLDQGSLVPALLATSAIPTLLPPVKIGGHELVDPGIVDAFGIFKALDLGAKSIVLINAATNRAPSPHGMADIFDRYTETVEANQLLQQKAAAVKAGVPILEIPVGAMGSLLDLTPQGAAKAIEEGRRAAVTAFEAFMAEIHRQDRTIR